MAQVFSQKYERKTRKKKLYVSPHAHTKQSICTVLYCTICTIQHGQRGKKYVQRREEFFHFIQGIFQLQLHVRSKKKFGLGGKICYYFPLAKIDFPF